MKIRSLLVAASLSTATLACGPKAALVDLIPEDKAVSINVPGGGSGQALVGAQSDFYNTTYNISRGINGTVAWVLGLSRAISLQQPTKVEGNTYTWGPSTPSGLERTAWRFTAVKQSEQHWTFHLDGRPKASTSDADWKVVYDGDVTKGAQNAHRGHGSLHLYFDNAQAVANKTCGNGNDDVLEGSAAITFAADAEPRTVDVVFTDFRNACDANAPTRQPAHYAYVEAVDGAGNFQFTAHGNIHKATENKPLIEKLTMRSRWQADGAGRSDVAIGEGEVPADLTAANIVGNSVIATECWDALFNVSYQTTEPTDLPQSIKDAIRPTEGVAASCVFSQAELPDAI